MNHDDWLLVTCPNCGSPVLEKLDEDGTPTYMQRTDMPKSSITGEKTVPVLYCDIDGTIRWGKDELGRFVNGPEDVRVFDEVPPLLAAYKALGWRIVGISNQGGIALGFMDRRACMQAMQATQEQVLGAFDQIAFCAHHPDAKDPEMRTCWCRKPKAGLVIESALSMSSQHRGEMYPPHLGLFVGDRPEDLACAENAGLPFMPANEWRRGDHIIQNPAVERMSDGLLVVDYKRV